MLGRGGGKDPDFELKDGKTSIWKKDISLGRKPKESAQAPDPAEATPAAEQASVWKKELSFKRKPKADREGAPAPEPTSVFKKELSFRRKPKEEQAPVASEAEATAVEAEHVPVEAPAAPEPVAAPDAGDYGWLTSGQAAVPAPEPEEAAPVEVVEAPAEEQTEPAPPTPLPAVPALPAPGPVLPPAAAVAVPEPVPEPVATPETVVHPPVPAAELPPLPNPEKRSLLKRDLSFGRKPKAEKAPKAGKKAKEPKPPKAEKEPKEKSTSKRKLSKPKFELRMPSLSRSKGDTAGPAAAKKHKHLVGLKVGASQLAAARVSNNGVAELEQIARVSLQTGVIVGGELRDPDALSEALKDFFRANKLPKRNVRLGIANNRIGVRMFDIEGIDDPKQLTNAIRFRAQEALPIPIEEAVLDYQVLSETVSEEGVRTRRILLVVAYRELIDRYVAACRAAGIKLVGIDLEAFALLRALSSPRAESDPPADAAVVVVSVGSDRSTFAVSDGRVCEFTRVLDWGGSALDVGIARALDMTPSEAEPIKRALALDGSLDPPEDISPERIEKAQSAIRSQLQTFARELVSSLQYYQNQPGSLGIGEIVLTGGTAHLPGLAAELQRLIGVSVRIGDPLVRVKIGKRVKDSEQIGSLAVAIGLGIED